MAFIPVPKRFGIMTVTRGGKLYVSKDIFGDSYDAAVICVDDKKNQVSVTLKPDYDANDIYLRKLLKSKNGSCLINIQSALRRLNVKVMDNKKIVNFEKIQDDRFILEMK